MEILYFTIAFIIFYFAYNMFARQDIKDYREKEKRRWGKVMLIDVLIDTKLIFFVMLSLLWMITVPCYLAWLLLDKLTRGKFKN